MSACRERRVLWVTKGLGPGGTERLLLAHAQSLDTGVLDVTCAYVRVDKSHLVQEFEVAGVATRCVSHGQRDWRWPWRLVRLVRTGGWDVVHVHAPLPGSVARMAARSLPGQRRPIVVTTEHNRWATHRLPTRLLNRSTSRWSDTIFTVTEQVRASMSGSARARARTLHHGIDVDATRAMSDRQAVRDELGLGDRDFVIGTVANFRAQKDHPTLLRAALVLVERGLPVRLVVVGQGPQESAVRALCSELGLDGHAVLTGFRADATRVMSGFDVFTLASRWEGLPVALMEALALGLPVVATNVGGITETMHDGRDALLVAPGDPVALADALERVVTDEPLRERLSGAGRDRADDFDVDRAVSVIHRAYGLEIPATRSDDVVATATAVSLGVSPTLDIRPATPDDRTQIIALCRAALRWGDDPRFEQLFAWKHDLNPFGPSAVWVATDDGRVIGLRAFMRWDFVRAGTVLHAVRAVDTAVHPEYQGRGLFTAMTTHGLEHLHADGIDFVFNTPNSQSRPGYLKMGWEVVGRVPVAVAVSSPLAAVRLLRSRGAASHWPAPTTGGRPFASATDAADLLLGGQVRGAAMATAVDRDFLEWRYGSELLGYRVWDADDGLVVGRIRVRGGTRELAVLDTVGLTRPEADRRIRTIMRDSGSTQAVRLGDATMTRGFVATRQGPTLVACTVQTEPSRLIADWDLRLGDVELM